MLRESREEIGIVLDRDDVRLVTTVHHRNAEGGARLGLFLAAVGAGPDAADGQPCARRRRCTP